MDRQDQINYGGQALIEGVMMRGRRRMAVAVRDPEGEIQLRTEPLNPAIYDGPVSRIPIVRGLISLWDSLGLGMKALMWSAEVSAGEEAEEVFQGVVGWSAVLIGVGLAVGLFMVLPSVLVGLLPLSVPPFVVNLLEGLVRVIIIVGYIWAVGWVPDIKRVYAYHGAEHKTINAYEAGVPLTVESVKEFPTAHPRCGTAFLLTVAVISILVLAPFGRPSLVWRIISRIALLPVIAGLSYEFIRFSARHADAPVLRWVIRPSLALQQLTTDEPDDPMLEVAIVSLKTLLEGEPAA
jgi:uncharacterized protein YqhQ